MTQLPLLTHRNHYLFSDYYLNHRVAERREWREVDAQPRLAALTQLWQARRASLPNANESQTEADWIRPVLDALGHRYTAQVPLVTPQGSKVPDYILCSDEATRTAIQTLHRPAAEADLAAALAVADAKAWNRPLDRSGPADSSKTLHANPALQIDFYIRHSGLAWGVLTNGRLWQLYHKDSSKKLDVYYEVDLPALIEANDAEAFKYFWLFFRREAFIAGSAASGAPAWLDLVLAESQAYQQGISAGLKEQVYEALAALAQGFLDFPGNGLTPDETTLRAIHDNSLIVLYRLLFILYAEDRDLLPVLENSTYRDSYSLQALKRRIAQEIDSGQPAAPSMSSLWQRLAELWRVIDGGDPYLGVPAYDGGLFKPANHPFLEQHRVGDLHLRKAIDLLARTRDPKTGTREVVDYRDLEIRHLGSIYEGLLEYQVRVAGEPLVVRKVKGKEVFETLPTSPIPQVGPVSPPDVLPGQVYLVTDKGERKATGSYYTPDYIVQYIVEHTVGPVLAEVAAPFLDTSGAARDPEKLARAILSVNLLDPSMGSGHFLVAAAEFVARFLVEKEVAAGGEIKEGDESQLAYWRRRVAQACIYGVDLNPLAVELAKLSLWLATVSKNKPLSFLDHHLRCGNSLIGARVVDLPLDAAGPSAGPSAAQKRKAAKAQVGEAALREAGQLSMLDDSAFAGSMRTASRFMDDIERLGSETLADVHESERIYVETVRKTTEKARLLADLWTARHFGLAIPDDVWQPLTKYLLHGGFVLQSWDQVIERGKQIAAERRFFHWELEFPEVFFDPHGRLQGDAAGFDAVIGNPPYVRQEELSPLKPYFALAYPKFYSGTADLFVYFFGQAIHLLREGGLTSYISSNSWLRAHYATLLRQFLRTQTTIVSLVDLGDNRVFADAPDVYPAIHVVRRALSSQDHSAQAAVFNRGEGTVDFPRQLETKIFPVTMHSQRDLGWQLEKDIYHRLFDKLKARGRPLDEIVNGRMYYGIKTGINDAFVIDQATRDRIIADSPVTADLLKPLLRGEDLRPWYQEQEGRWLILIPAGWTRNFLGAELTEEHAWARFTEALHPIAEHLKPFADRARKRYDKGDYWWELRPCDYYGAFDVPKILWPDITKFPRFSYDDTGSYLGNTGYIAVADEPWLLGYLGSRCAWFLISRTAIGLGERAGFQRYRLIDQYMRPLPVPNPTREDAYLIGNVAVSITTTSRHRYDLHRKTRNRIQNDLGTRSERFNLKLAAWWELDFSTFRNEINKVFKRDIPLKQRDEWESWLAEQRAEHERLTAKIVRLETELNARVYELFDLTPAEIKIIEESTKYRYGEA